MVAVLDHPFYRNEVRRRNPWTPISLRQQSSDQLVVDFCGDPSETQFKGIVFVNEVSQVERPDPFVDVFLRRHFVGNGDDEFCEFSGTSNRSSIKFVFVGCVVQWLLSNNVWDHRAGSVKVTIKKDAQARLRCIPWLSANPTSIDIAQRANTKRTTIARKSNRRNQRASRIER